MDILYPPLVLMGLTFFCLFRLGYLRAKAVAAGEIKARFFESYRGDDEPDRLRIHSRHLVNLFEVPVLFYAITLINAVAGVTASLDVIFAWTYVTLRFVHSWVHLTSNNVLLRFRIFALSALILVALWISTVAGVVRQ